MAKIVNASRKLFDSKQVQEFFKEIKHESSKKANAIDMSHNYIIDSNVADIGKFLRHDKLIRKLDLTFNYVSDTGCKQLAKSLIVNTNLKTLYLENNNISNRGVSYLIQMLKLNHTLTKIRCANFTFQIKKEMINKLEKLCGMNEKYGKEKKTLNSIFPPDLAINILSFIM